MLTGAAQVAALQAQLDSKDQDLAGAQAAVTRLQGELLLQDQQVWQSVTWWA